MGDDTARRDPDHWLHRLGTDEWLAAAANELRLTVEAAGARQHKKAVVLARRAAGMALNAYLIHHPDDAWGRSYVEHLRAAATDAHVDAEVQQACAQLLDAALEAPKLVRIGGGGDEGLAAAAATVIDWAQTRVQDRERPVH